MPSTEVPVSHGAENGTFVGVNWGSTNFRAYLIGADGAAIDDYTAPAGVVALDREGMAATLLADICGDCGCVQLRVESPNELYQHFERTLPHEDMG